MNIRTRITPNTDTFCEVLILRTAAYWENFLIAFRTGSSLKSENMRRPILSLYKFLKMILEFSNYTFFFCYNLVSVNKGYSLVFESLATKIWFGSLPSFLLPVTLFTLKLLPKPFLHFHLSQKSTCFRQRDFRHYIIPIVVKNMRVRVIIAFLTYLFLKWDWLHLKCFFFVGHEYQKLSRN